MERGTEYSIAVGGNVGMGTRIIFVSGGGVEASSMQMTSSGVKCAFTLS